MWAKPTRADHARSAGAVRRVLLAWALVLGGCDSMQKLAPWQKQSPPPPAQASAELAAALDQAVVLVTELKYDQAIEKLRLLLPSLQASGDSRRAAEAMFWIGYCHEKQSRFDPATVWYRRVVNEYPDTPAADQARQRLPRLESPQ